MAASKADQPPRFVVQCAKGKSWKTLVVDESSTAAERAFKEIVKVKPRGYFRLIRLDYNGKADAEGLEFDWKLLALHDPRKGAAKAGERPSKERVPIPLRLYGLALIGGLLLALLALLWFHPA